MRLTYGYVIFEWNQAGGPPIVADTEVYTDKEEALERAQELTAAAAPRRETYTVHPVDDEVSE